MLAGLTRIVIGLHLLFAFISLASAQGQCPNPPVPTITSSEIPTDVCIPANFNALPIDFFDDYSWRAFIGTVWPAASGQRGKPDSAKTVAGGGPRVFETYKSTWELFHNDGSAPAGWNTYDDAKFNACGAQASFGDVILGSFSKFSDIGQAGVGSLVGPLVAQNRTYVRYLTGFNEIEFKQIVDPARPLYLRANLPMTTPFESGAIDIKSSWILMKGMPHPERYYTRAALVLDPATGKCSTEEVGLVGLHIVQKTPTRPQWIWSTFEQIDNVPPAFPGAPGTFAFNDGTAAAMPDKNPYPINPPILPTPAPFNVKRTMPIAPQTQKTNGEYRKLLQAAGSRWQFYQLVMTQWPVPGSKPDQKGDPDHTFPGFGDNSAFANVTMETFDQGDVRKGCMNCHNATRDGTDFLWSLKDHAFPPNVPGFLFLDAAFQNLKSLLKDPVK